MRVRACVYAFTTMIVQVLDEYFNRAPESTKLDFITMKGFDLLAWQVSHDLFS